MKPPEMFDRIARLEVQTQRFISDLESEKETRARVHSEMDKRLRAVEIANWKAAGALGVLIVLSQWLPKLLALKL